MKRLAMTVLVSALSTGAMASVSGASSAVLADYTSICQQPVTDHSCARFAEVMQRNAEVAKLLNDQALEMKEAYFAILEMKNPEQAFDEQLDTLDVFVRGLEELAKQQYFKVQKAVPDDKECREFLSSCRQVISGINRVRVSIGDLMRLEKQFNSSTVMADSEFEPSEEFYAAMHQATITAYNIH